LKLKLLFVTGGFVEEKTGESITPYVLIVNPGEVNYLDLLSIIN